MAKNLVELDNKVMELEIAHTKANIMCGDLKEDYFGYINPEESFLKCRYHENEIKAQIIYDYLHEMKSLIEELRVLVDKEFEMTKSQIA